MDVEKLWQKYEESIIKEIQAKNIEESEKNYFAMVDAIAQNGISNGILQCLKEIEGNSKETLGRAYRLYAKARGINVDTGFGFWVPVIERLPKEGTHVIACLDDGFITGVEFEEDGEWGLWADSGEVVAWMPLPDPYQEKH